MGRGRGGNEDGAVAVKEWKGGGMEFFSSLLDTLGVSPAHKLYTVRNQTCHRLGSGLCSTVACRDYHSDSSAGCAAPLSLPFSIRRLLQRRHPSSSCAALMTHGLRYGMTGRLYSPASTSCGHTHAACAHAAVESSTSIGSSQSFKIRSLQERGTLGRR